MQNEAVVAPMAGSVEFCIWRESGVGRSILC
jgi:hypothetical protein